MQRTGDQIYIVYGAGYVYYELIWRYLFLAASSDGGNTWTRTIMSTPSKNGEHKSLAGHDDSYSPKIAIADNNVYVTWAGYDQNDEIY